MEIPVYASTGAFVTRANGRNFHLIPRIAPLLDCDGLEFMMYESWAGQEAEIAAELRDSGVRFPSMHLDKRIGDTLGIPCRIADAPSKCAARGLYAIMHAPEKYDAAVLCHSRRGSWR